MSISGISSNYSGYYNTATQSVAKNKQIPAQKQDEVILSGKGMSFEEFEKLINSDAPLEDKLVGIQDAFGNIVNMDALETSIKAVQDGKMSMAEIYKRSISRSATLTRTEDDVRASFEANHGFGLEHLKTSNNDPENLKKYGPILSKLQSGGTLTQAEKSFLREHYPDTYSMAIKAEQEAAQIKDAMRGAGSKDEARQILLDAKTAALSGDSKKVDLFLIGLLNKINPDNLDDDNSKKFNQLI